MDAFEAISLPEPSSLAGKKHFRLVDANRSLVLVRRIATDIVNNYRRLRQLHDSYQALDQIGDITDAERTRQEYLSITDHLSELREELEEIGCELKDFELGLVDFPSMREDREVHLCWKLGESQIGFWHEAAAGFKGRQPIDEHTS